MESVKIEIENLVDINLLSEEYDISKEELISFHNQNCTLHELLPEQLPKYIKHIYIPLDKYNQWKKKQILSAHIEIPEFSGEFTYGVSIRQEPSDLKMHYLTDIQRLPGNTVSVSRQKLYVNDEEVNLMVEKLIETAGEALYPIHLSLHQQGNLSEIKNGKDIQIRWKEVYLPKIRERYVGETTDEMIAKFNRFYEHIETGMVSLQHNIFYPVFFLPLYDRYPNYQKKEQVEFYFPNLGETVLYDAVFSLQKMYTDRGRILVHITGDQCYEEISLDEKKGKIDLVYRLDKKTRNISSVTGTLSTFYDHQEIKIFIEIYQQESYL
ncbi:hypothetical protein PFY12_02510 [Chryseobacterium camelliae]|uniref:Uncharacterized protein n=1 Tax=Chryseobacterium camelliae TaxID=1265445 RepID=A0ABY7QP69_9FLAO|nr:hypothetical protein [Chryseobacterium camelliae]WBV61003.1 hypothetical protein PFY12_02510 [Chryseobacterium camelliae]